MVGGDIRNEISGVVFPNRVIANLQIHFHPPPMVTKPISGLKALQDLRVTRFPAPVEPLQALIHAGQGLP